MNDLAEFIGYLVMLVVSVVILFLSALWVFPSTTDLEINMNDPMAEICQTEYGWFSLQAERICLPINGQVIIE